MLFARPPGGFEVVEPPEITRRINGAKIKWPALGHAWLALKSRLALVGHREGTPVEGEGSGIYILSADSLNLPGLPDLTVLYQILGVTLTLRSVLISDPDGQD